MERNEVSIHEVRLYLALAENGSWITSAALASKAQVAPRTARAHLLKLVNLNLVDVAEVFPAHRYRISEKASKRNAGYLTRLTAAAEVFGLRKPE